MTSEEWRPVVGWESLYEVSSHGRVRSLDRVVRRGGGDQLKPGRILKIRQDKGTGTAIADLCRDSRAFKRRVGRLVLEAFVGPSPQDMQCCHWDDVKTNNHLENLRWDTCSANKYDSVRNGIHCNANKTHCPKGHEYTPTNTRINTSGGRYCVECHRFRNRRYRKLLAS